MIVFDRDNHRFQYRVAGVCIREEHVLLHRGIADDFWSLPGGRVELAEKSRQTLAREMKEELGETIEVSRLLWVVENFFEDNDRFVHELSFLYEMDLPADSPYGDPNVEHRGIEPEHPLIYRWFPLDLLETVRLFPTFLRGRLRVLPGTIEHIVHFDEDNQPPVEVPRRLICLHAAVNIRFF